MNSSDWSSVFTIFYHADWWSAAAGGCRCQWLGNVPQIRGWMNIKEYKRCIRKGNDYMAMLRADGSYI